MQNEFQGSKLEREVMTCVKMPHLPAHKNSMNSHFYLMTTHLVLQLHHQKFSLPSYSAGCSNVNLCSELPSHQSSSLTNRPEFYPPSSTAFPLYWSIFPPDMAKPTSTTTTSAIPFSTCSGCNAIYVCAYILGWRTTGVFTTIASVFGSFTFTIFPR